MTNNDLIIFSHITTCSWVHTLHHFRT